ncbi:MAG: DUF2071 domain-containing protein [Verrucomicrobiales bacterium]|nr:DUF2071 domain-containing protein [Verrucomicrobiales bacterium]
MIPLLPRLVTDVAGTIKRRVLVNFRVDASQAVRQLPPPFRPQLVRGHALVGICLIRLEHLRPTGIPECFGLASENAAHRIAVEWTREGRMHQGVFVARRHTDSTLNDWAGGRIFPGVHQKASFECDQTGDRLRVALTSAGAGDPERIELSARLSESVPSTSVFANLGEASDFFRNGCAGWSIAQDGITLEGAQLEASNWELQPLTVEHVHSSLLEEWFGTVGSGLEFDSAFLMQEVPHRWFSLGKWPGPPPSQVIRRRPSHGRRHAALFELP